MMMLGMEEILCELLDDHEQGGLLPPGFRFHPTDEELITFYLASKVFHATSTFSTSVVDIAEVDLNRCEPWELPDAAKMGEREWYFFSLRDRKYPTGLRTNRATGAGYWKATGKDREVYGGGGALLGMKKTLVFYKGRAPRGEKTKWVMHEYRLDGDFSCRNTGKEEWVICRIFHKIGDKKNPTMLLHPQQNYLFPNNTNSLPPLLEPPPPTLLESQDNYPTIMQTLNQNQNSFLNIHNQEDYQSELKTLIDPQNILQSSDITLKRPFLPNQDYAFKELSNAIAKQCKKEAGVGAFDDQLAHFQLLSGGNAKWGGSYNMNQDMSPFLFGLGGEMGLIPSSSSSSSTVDHSHVIQNTALDHHHHHHHHADGMSTQPAFKWW